MQKFIIFFGLITLASCYRMPQDDEYSVVPSTNNPQVTKERQSGPLPQLSY